MKRKKRNETGIVAGVLPEGKSKRGKKEGKLRSFEVIGLLATPTLSVKEDHKGDLN